MRKRPPKPPDSVAPDDKLQPITSVPGAFPIVGIGASAGGLEALEQFFSQVPEDSGLAWIVIQHQDPTHSSLLPELLQRKTSLPVMVASDQTSIQRDRVYVSPPNRDVSILHGSLRLYEPTEPRGLRLPIDVLFRSLAEERGSASVGVLLSGMGSDGTQGLRDIQHQGGLTLAQAPATAKFDGMPTSAIAAGAADIVAPADQLPDLLLAALQHNGRTPRWLDAQGQGAVGQVLNLIHQQTRHDFSQYKLNTLHRRIERRMGIHRLDRLEDYARFLGANPQEIDLLFRELLIGVTRFFRDATAWDSLKTQALPALFAALGERTHLRAWVAACSSGEEAYSLAIVFQEALEALEPQRSLTLQIFATDLDAQAIAIARRGVYPLAIAADVSPERLDRYFVPVESGYRVDQAIRDRVIFAPQNLIADPPFTKLDLLSCRNLLIYLTPPLQKN